MIARRGHREADGPAALVVDHVADPDGCQEVIAGLMDEYKRYVESEHAICPACPVVRTGPVIVHSMLQWKATDRDGRLGRWTVEDIHAYLLEHLPREVVDDRVLLRNAPTCAKDLVYFMSDRGTLAGDSIDALTDATDDVLDGFSSANGDGAGAALAEHDDARTSGPESPRYAHSEPPAQHGVEMPGVKAGNRGQGTSARRAKRKAAQASRKRNRR
jgi:hypothetical protein